MHHQQRTRKALTSQQEEYIKRITQPKTPEDVVLALQNPLSTIYRDAINMLIAHVQMEIIIEKLIQHYLLHDFQIKEQEKEELIKALLLADAKRAMQRDLLQLPKVVQYKKSIENMDLSHAKQQWEKNTEIVKKLKNRIISYENDLHQTKETETVLKQKWKQIAQERRAAYVEKLQQQNLFFIGADGQIIAINSERGRKIIDIRSGFKSSPFEVIKAVKISIEIAKEQNLFLPEEFREPSKDPHMLVEYQSMMDELKAVTEAARDKKGKKQTGAKLYDVSVANREQFKLGTKPPNLPPNLPNVPRNFTVKKSTSAESVYTKSLLTQSKIEDENIQPNEYKQDVILPSKDIAKQRSGFLAELNGLSADAEGKTGAELLRALKAQKVKKLGEAAADVTQVKGKNENSVNQNKNISQRIKMEVAENQKNAASHDSIKLEFLYSKQISLMIDSLAFLDVQSAMKNKLSHAKANLEFAEKLVKEDIRQCNKLLSGEVKNDRSGVNLPTKQNNN